MRRVAVLLSVVAAIVTPAAAHAQERVDAQLLLDLDLLREADPARHRDQGLAERLRLLEMLRLLESPAAATPAREPVPEPQTPPRGAR